MKKILLTLISGLLCGNIVAASSAIGTSGAQFLKIGAGARSTAMADAFVAIADDVNSVTFNPAGLSNLERPELIAMHTQWIRDLNYDFGAFAYPTQNGTYAFSAATLKASDLEKRNADESYVGQFDALDAAYALSYGRSLSEKLSLGVTTRYIRQEIDSRAASTIAADIGALRKFKTRHPFQVGLAIKNAGGKIKFDTESDALPLTMDLGVSSKFLKDNLTVGIDLRKPNDNDLQTGVGGEYANHIRNDFRYAFRAGHTTQSADADGASGISLGAGIGYKQFGFDFAWVPFGDLGNTFRYAAQFKF